MGYLKDEVNKGCKRGAVSFSISFFSPMIGTLGD